MTSIDNYYCSQKFWALTVNLERSVLHSCCAADPEKIDINWIQQNPGMLFNTPNLQQERKNMLNNIPVKGCETNCWIPEKNGLTSRRTQFASIEKTHTNIDTCSPKNLNIVLGSVCNLTCSYCCKQYSTAWLRDVITQGPYLDDQRFLPTPQEKVLLKIGQEQLTNSKQFGLILDQLSAFDNVDQITISGGEPLLYKNFSGLINALTQSKEIIFFTGLGLGSAALKKQLSKISDRQNLKVVVSAENCDQFYEFNRYGISYQQFLNNLDLLINGQFDVSFASTLSNLTIFGFVDFVKQFGHKQIKFKFCNDPDYLGVHVLDYDSKNYVTHMIRNSNVPDSETIISNIGKDYTSQQKEKFCMFFKNFSSRRGLDYTIYPKSMMDWVNS